MPIKLKKIVSSGEIRVGLGLRNIKTTVAVVMCMLIYELVYRIAQSMGANMQYAIPFYASAAAIICMQTTVQKTLSDGFVRIIGTLYGGVLGILVLFIGAYTPHFIEIFMIAVAVSLSICLCNLTGQQHASSICCVVLLAMVVNQDGVPQYIHALSRLLETIAGIIVAALVNRFFFIPQWMCSIKAFFLKKCHTILEKRKNENE